MKKQLNEKQLTIISALIAAGVLLVLIRAFSIHTDGAIFVVLLMNLGSPLLDRIRPKVVGLEVKSDA